MRATIPLLLLTAACNQWVRPDPREPRPRNMYEQRLAAVRLEMSCDLFAGFSNRVGSGVMVSDWQVLTALYTADCQSTIAFDGKVERAYRFAPERKWALVDVARIQMAYYGGQGYGGSTGWITYDADTKQGMSGDGIYDLAGTSRRSTSGR